MLRHEGHLFWVQDAAYVGSRSRESREAERAVVARREEQAGWAHDDDSRRYQEEGIDGQLDRECTKDPINTSVYITADICSSPSPDAPYPHVPTTERDLDPLLLRRSRPSSTSRAYAISTAVSDDF